MMTNYDPEGHIILSNPHTNNGFFFLLTFDTLFKDKISKLPDVPEYTEMQFYMTKAL